MDIDSLTDDQLDDLASKLAGRLPTGRHGDRFVLNRRQLFTAVAGGSAGVAALVKLGIDPATAQQAAGQVGTASSPEDIYAHDLDVQGALQSDLDAGGQAIENAGSVSTGEATIASNTALRNTAERGTSIGFGDWRTPDANRPVIVNTSAVAETDGSSDGRIRLSVDKAGGTIPNYDHDVARVEASSGAGTRIGSTALVVVPPGGAYKIDNFSDPTSNNTLFDNREFVL